MGSFVWISFCMDKFSEGKIVLRKNHAYYYQV